jgi:hypothetical protein
VGGGRGDRKVGQQQQGQQRASNQSIHRQCHGISLVQHTLVATDR